MPELPDLEVFKTNIFNRLTSKKLTDAEVFNQLKVNAVRQMLLEELEGRELKSIERVGKELYFDFGGDRLVTAHLMLNGEISILPPEEAAAKKFKIFSMSFGSETMVFSDRGSLCTVKLFTPQKKLPPAKAPDAFDEAFSLEYFLGVARKKSRVNVKVFLIDQSIVRGIGNAYADEILWAARISPKSVMGGIPEERLTALYNAAGEVLREAVESIKRISPDRISGEERSFLKVHNKSLKKTETGYPIIVDRIASKITYYTEEQAVYI